VYKKKFCEDGAGFGMQLRRGRGRSHKAIIVVTIGGLLKQTI
jgi:hypothetical protein